LVAGDAQFHATSQTGVVATTVRVLHRLQQGARSEPDSIAEMKSYSRAARDIVQPNTEISFAGNLDPATLSLFERLVVKMISSPIGDFRDWSAIKAWGQELATRFSTG
jgi:menaquinone-dependent protoporphyrinogen IX oxidase